MSVTVFTFMLTTHAKCLHRTRCCHDPVPSLETLMNTTSTWTRTGSCLCSSSSCQHLRHSPCSCIRVDDDVREPRPGRKVSTSCHAVLRRTQHHGWLRDGPISCAVPKPRIQSTAPPADRAFLRDVHQCSGREKASEIPCPLDIVSTSPLDTVRASVCDVPHLCAVR